MAKKGKDYEAIAKEKITRPSEQPQTLKFLFYSRNKVGKTNLVMSAGIDDTLIADPEHGTDPYIKQDPQVWHIEQWDDLDDYYNFLKTGNHSLKWAGLDGMTRMHNMALKKVMKVQEETDLTRVPGFVRRQDYGKANELTKGMLYNFLNLPMGVIITCQERIIETEIDDGTGEITEVQVEKVPDLPRGARTAVSEIADLIGRLYVVRVKARIKGTKKIKTINQRRLQVGPSDRYSTGYRSDFNLPSVVKNPTVPKLVKLMTTERTK